MSSSDSEPTKKSFFRYFFLSFVLIFRYYCFNNYAGQYKAEVLPQQLVPGQQGMLKKIDANIERSAHLRSAIDLDGVITHNISYSQSKHIFSQSRFSHISFALVVVSPVHILLFREKKAVFRLKMMTDQLIIDATQLAPRIHELVNIFHSYLFGDNKSVQTYLFSFFQATYLREVIAERQGRQTFPYPSVINVRGT